MTIQKFTFNPFQENTYVLTNMDNEAWIVDPGCSNASELNELTNYISSNKLLVKGIIATHCHLDHIFGAHDLCEKFDLPFTIPSKDLPTYDRAPQSAAMFGIPTFPLPEKVSYGLEPGEMNFGKEKCEIRFTPGHSVGHVVFIFHQDRFVVGGDVLFNGSIGRTDLPGGNFETLENSIKTQLYTLDDDYTVYSGHGPETKIGLEKQSNPFVKG